MKTSHLRTLTLSALVAATLLAAGCASNVPLEDKNAGGAAPISSANMPGGANASGANNSALASTSVAPVVIAPTDASANGGDLTRVIYFDFDSFIVKEDFRAAIEGHAKRLSAAKGKKVLVEGHTDERGGHEYNLALGQKRAEAVQKSLTLLGVSADQVEAVSFGEERPAVQGSGEEAWAQNRRAEIKDR
jgi:peptidoglycan-associated lipoprotein